MPHEQIPTWGRDPARRGTLAPLRGSRYRLVDAHLHVVNFLQESPGGDALIEHMDRAGVAGAVVFGLPVTKLWAEYDRDEPDYYLANDARCYYYGYTDVIVAEMVRALPAPGRERLFPLLCGFNPTDTLGIRHVERLFARYPDVWCGIGELLLRHDDLTALTYGDAARANHRALWPVYAFAGDHDLPVLIHHNVTSVTRHTHPIYLWEFEEVVRDFPRTRFILAHCGMSRRVEVPFYYQMIERLLDQYPNVSVDYSWIIFDVAVCPQGRPSEPWLALTEKHHTRITLGSDLVTRFERLGPELFRYDAFLDQLGEEARENVCWRNAERIYG
ncbi:MAG: amidohydrolase, partial [Acidobacteria bacterium]|nr:amidohydrolase [Acidobacteriota bacterium]